MRKCTNCKYHRSEFPLMILDPSAVCEHPKSKTMVAELLDYSYLHECRTMRLNEAACGESAKLHEKPWWKLW